MMFKSIHLGSFSHDILTAARNDKIEFNLNNGDSFAMDKSELFDAINILTSNEFNELIEAHNAYEKWHEREDIAYSQAISKTTNGSWYDLVKAASRRGYYKGVIETITQRICDSAPYFAWYKARCLYECLTGIDRDLL